MKKIVLISVLFVFTQSVFAQDKPTIPKSQKAEGCVYADVVYNVGEKHRVQQSVTDPVTNKVTMVDVKLEIWQECIENIDAEKTKSPRFYWKTIASNK